MKVVNVNYPEDKKLEKRLIKGLTKRIRRKGLKGRFIRTLTYWFLAGVAGYNLCKYEVGEEIHQHGYENMPKYAEFYSDINEKIKVAGKTFDEKAGPAMDSLGKKIDEDIMPAVEKTTTGLRNLINKAKTYQANSAQK